jgi:hypothetical protein
MIALFNSPAPHLQRGKPLLELQMSDTWLLAAAAVVIAVTVVFIGVAAVVEVKFSIQL